jgi:hypothetical protein
MIPDSLLYIMFMLFDQDIISIEDINEIIYWREITYRKKN